MGTWQRIKESLRRRSPLVLVAIGIVVGGVAMIGFDRTLHYTSTNEFCMYCHADNAGKEWKQSIHHQNRQGVVVDCSHCHIPQEFIPKMTIKILAVADVWGHIQGRIDTPEKYEALRLEMAETVWARMKANDSSECRTCHQPEAMTNPDKPLMRPLHVNAQKDGKICTECHDGVAHKAPEMPEDEEE
jgi:nitrate/TMAO reductase-like tetraheme cytochrome c subunit